jgi:hypothetical protein
MTSQKRRPFVMAKGGGHSKNRKPPSPKKPGKLVIVRGKKKK